ncbi:zinc-binding dehydrogenase [Cellulomonas cellasea]|uniref:NADPH2:quinone reductase n=1 Tax=Cellulomonas cellasea TaxID=43670 RepID=A0A7W4YCM0_9CELL|nr:zinc-binding dehydrogenase [Cellulomonas cellasea]MBB2923666.1 NADPH2:quinone reductase [Cellulomonas cellasea]
MRAVQFSEHGPPGVLRVAEVPEPAPGRSDVLVEVVCAGVTFAEVMFRRGQLPVGLPHVPGLAVSGWVVEVGDAVTTLRPGQRVAALTLAGGGGAELVVAPESTVVALEGELDRLSDAVAAAVPCSVTTAWGLLEAARVQPGETVLVLAAAGGVGSAAVQLAVAQGATVLAAVGHGAKRAAARSWGARHVVTYDELGDLDDLLGGRRVDVVLDAVGGPVRRAAAATLGFGGRHVVYGDASATDVVISTNAVWLTGTSLVGHNLGALAAAAPERLRTHLTEALHAVADGTVGLDVTEHPLADVAVAHAALESRASTGTHVLRVQGPGTGSRPGPAVG